MNSKHLILLISGLTIFLFLFKWGTSTPEMTDGQSDNTPQPVQAPRPVTAIHLSTPEPERVALSRQMPEPQPVPEPPGREIVVSANPNSETTPVGPLPFTLFVSTVGLFTGFLILLHSRRQDNGRSTQTPFAVNGAQS